MAVSFPFKNQHGSAKVRHFWGIEWAVKQTEESPAYGFVSTLSSSWVPENVHGFYEEFWRKYANSGGEFVWKR
jgi:hypothetical protein